MPDTPPILPHDVLVDLPAADPAQLFQRIADRVAGADARLAGRISRRLARRHAHASVALGGGVALPHAAVPGLTKARSLFVRTAQALDLQAADGEPVRHFLTLLVPFPAMGIDYDRLMVWSRQLARVELVGALRRAADAAALHRVLIDFRLVPDIPPG